MDDKRYISELSIEYSSLNSVPVDSIPDQKLRVSQHLVPCWSLGISLILLHNEKKIDKIVFDF